MFSKTIFALIISGAFCIACPAQPVLHNPSSPAVHYVTVAKNLQLEVLDWGGTGKPIVLLAGGGNTAHAFDAFAPKLAAHFHVYGITRRGFGSSQFSPVVNVDRLAEDILAVLDSMKISNPILVGHSVAGAELTSIARSSRDRVSALIYLEAGYPYAFSNSQSPSMKDFFDVKGPQQPSPGENNLISFKTLQDWNTETYGFELPESELRQLWDSTTSGRPTRRRSFPGFDVFPIMLNNQEKLDKIPLPSLVIYAIPHAREKWMINSTEERLRSEGQAYFSKIDSLTVKQANALEAGVPTARIKA
jgi:non-heme chloroperoxidase